MPQIAEVRQQIADLTQGLTPETSAEEVQRRLGQLDLLERAAQAQLNSSIMESVSAFGYSNAGDLNRESPYGNEAGWSWLPLGLGGSQSSPQERKSFVHTPEQLADLRLRSRLLAQGNPYAISALENLVSYVVGTGLTHTVEPRRKARKATDGLPAREASATDEELDRVQEALDAIAEANELGELEQELWRRANRDGECFVRVHAPRPSELAQAEGEIAAAHLRANDPETIEAPANATPEEDYGIRVDSEDAEWVQAYRINEEWIDAGQVEHLKLNVDRNVKRGLGTLIPAEDNLRRADRLLRNMSTVAEIHAAIALVKRYETATKGQITAHLAGQATLERKASREQGGTRDVPVRELHEGTILNAPKGVTYEDPFTGRDPGRGVAVLQAELRAVAAMLVMPEYMLTADASNANYASTFVAGGPAFRAMERRQETFACFMRRLLRKALRAMGLDESLLRRIKIKSTCESVEVVDRLSETQRNSILNEAGVKSARTWSEEEGLDYESEQGRLEQERERSMANGEAGPLPIPDDDEEHDEDPDPSAGSVPPAPPAIEEDDAEDEDESE